MRIINAMAPGARRLTCRHFGVVPQTFYRWKRRYDPGRLGSMEDRLRRPAAAPERAQAVLEIREANPR